ncbi:hypothetical protein ACFXPY_17360 [Streptomyces sp. NPDC059153]|uniref:hypothetical protein n=1 Tax=unclassified Streptomyces TaxID=2593676 RepID=UPI00367D8445
MTWRIRHIVHGRNGTTLSGTGAPPGGKRARGTIGGTYPFWQRHRYTRSKTFPRLHVVLAGKEEHLLDDRLQALTADVQGIAVAVWANTLLRLQRGEPWYEIGVDDPDRRRTWYPEPVGR